MFLYNDRANRVSRRHIGPFSIFYATAAAALALLLSTVTLAGAGKADDEERKRPFPRLMGMNIGNPKDYHRTEYQRQLAKLDVVILGFYSTWNPERAKDPIRRVAKNIKAINPEILIGQYTVMNEAYDDPHNVANKDKYSKLHKESWWLRNAREEKVQWTNKYAAWEVNFTRWIRPDKDGKRYPEWLAERDYNLYFSKVPEFDIWYFDNVMRKPRIKSADWDLDGKEDRGDNARIVEAYREGHANEWAAARELHPTILLMGNPDNDLSSVQYKKMLNGAFLEALIGKSWSLESWKGWKAMMKHYHQTMNNTIEPRLVGFNVWGDKNDYRLFRYGFASSMLDDGYFSYTSRDKGYYGVAWFDEYDVDLGHAIEPPQYEAWLQGIHRRRFENGMVLVNPNKRAIKIRLEPGYKRIAGRQDPMVNNGKLADFITLGAKDGIVLLRDN